ncbi:MAG: ferric reductase-like transmembrane domain-containing protein [Spirochaetales bacterium]|nr:ferric reductase-like transmembrane domain-containing protein [Spirochaetales bacterium]
MKKAWPMIALYSAGFLVSFYYWGLSLNFDPSRVNANALSGLAALLGFTAMGFQLVSAARWRLFEDMAGLDVLLTLHRLMGVLAFVMILFHGGFHMAQNMSAGLTPDGVEGLGVIALFLLTAASITAMAYKGLRLSYEAFRIVHFITVPVYVIGLFHSISLGTTLKSNPDFLTIWYAFAFIAGLSLLKTAAGKLRLFLSRHTVEAVETDSSGITRLHLGAGDLQFTPGQFMFVGAGKGLHALMPHPFTATSVPGSPRLSFAVKECGDFTRGAASLMPGEKVHIDGPYGVFTLPANGIGPADRVLCIAGGIGITPFLAWLRGTPREALPADLVLLWGNKTPSDAVFAAELEDLSRDKGFTVVHAFSRAGGKGIPLDFPGTGVLGRIDAGLLASYGAPLAERHVFVCGPGTMMRDMAKILRAQGVKGSRIHSERFAF